jgi:hypothetical protein
MRLLVVLYRSLTTNIVWGVGLVCVSGLAKPFLRLTVCPSRMPQTKSAGSARYPGIALASVAVTDRV